METKLFFLVCLSSFTLLSQNNKLELRKYNLINELGDTSIVYGKKLSIEKIQGGFKIFDEKGNKIKEKVTPDNFKYISYKLDNGKMEILKSLPAKVKLVAYSYKNAFMSILIEHSEQDLKRGKINLYIHTYKVHIKELGSGSHITGIVYFEDEKGTHRVNHKNHYKRYPKLLGIEIYKKMKKSGWGNLGFLYEYFTKHNKSIGNKEI